MEHVPWEIFLFIIAAIIAVIQKVWEASREVRRRSMERERRENREGGATLEDEPPPPPSTGRALPAPSRRPQAPGPLLPPPPARPRPKVRPLPPRPAREAARPAPMPRPQAPAPAARARPVSRAPQVTDLRRQHRLRAHVFAMLRDRAGGLRDAVILREVLGPPRALRRAPWIR